jgi:hypothetical protein
MAEKKLDLPDPLRPTRRLRPGLWREEGELADGKEEGGRREGAREGVDEGLVAVRLEPLDLYGGDAL